MINNKGSFYLGVFVFLIPFLGFPTIWKMGLVIFAGSLLVLTSLRIPTPRKTFKAKSKKETGGQVNSQANSQMNSHQPLENIPSPVISVPAPAPTITPAGVPINIPVIKIEATPKVPIQAKKPKAVPLTRPRVSKMDSVRRSNISQQ